MGKIRRRRVPRKTFSTRTTIAKNYRRKKNRREEILLKWWQTKYPMTEGQRNHNVYVIAQALNEFGINKTTASIICNNYATKDFPSREIETTIEKR
ncbi:MAG: hypothetical protein ACXAAH_17945 [Promethearchaeota archaeon]|jgi:hypothetical protein